MKTPESEQITPKSLSMPGVIAQLSKARTALCRVLPNHKRGPKHSSLNDEPEIAFPINLSELSQAFAEVARTRTMLESRECNSSPELDAALSEYQLLLRHFKSKLPRFHGWLLSERARLASRRSHYAAVENWISTSRQTR